MSHPVELRSRVQTLDIFEKYGGRFGSFGGCCFMQGKVFWRFSLVICISVACSNIIIRNIYLLIWKSNLQRLMHVGGSVFRR